MRRLFATWASAALVFFYGTSSPASAADVALAVPDENRLIRLESKVDAINDRLAGIEKRMDQRMDRIEQRMDRRSMLRPLEADMRRLEGDLATKGSKNVLDATVNALRTWAAGASATGGRPQAPEPDVVRRSGDLNLIQYSNTKLLCRLDYGHRNQGSGYVSD